MREQTSALLFPFFSVLSSSPPMWILDLSPSLPCRSKKTHLLFLSKPRLLSSASFSTPFVFRSVWEVIDCSSHLVSSTVLPCSLPLPLSPGAFSSFQAHRQEPECRYSGNEGRGFRPATSFFLLALGRGAFRAVAFLHAFVQRNTNLFRRQGKE